MATDEPPSRGRHKRTRTGCDEGKPKCQRCVDGGFDCQYGPRLTFLHKNALTLSPTPSSSETQYSRLQFVNPGPSTSTSATSTEGDGSGGGGGTVISPTTPGTSLETLFESAHQRHGTPELAIADPEEPETILDDHTTPGTWQQDGTGGGGGGSHMHSSPQHSLVVMPEKMQASPKDADYQTALTVLLSLGNDEPPQVIHSPNQKRIATLHPPMVSSPSGSSAGAPATAKISQDRLLQLLRHYRYQVAPWLDICDMGQAFGLVVPRLAMESEGALYALLSLAAVSQQADPRTQTSDVEYLGALAEASFMRQHGFDPFNDTDLTLVALANLGTALVNGTTVSIPEQLNYPATPTQWETSVIADTLFQYAVEPLLLCAQVVNFGACAFPAQASTIGGAPQSPVKRWTMISDALSTWYANRPQEFRPMIEMEIDESLFPVVLFTNGAAVFANQLYHTAMLLLLQNRPRTLAAGPRKAPAMSPLWHAQRVCGIAVNNDRRDSWDLCLVASLYRAAQRMTYEPQQLAILGCFEKIKAVTGWDVNSFVEKVREDWGLVSG
ncbi:hypothetical protein ACHAQA_005165 [Verticillium albo-atrum]